MTEINWSMIAGFAIGCILGNLLAILVRHWWQQR